MGYRFEGERMNIVNTSIISADSLLGVKYVLSPYDIKGLEKVEQYGKYNDKYVYLNKYALPLAFKYYSNNHASYNNNPFEYQNEVYSELIGEKCELFKKADYRISKNENEITFEIENTNKNYVTYAQYKEYIRKSDELPDYVSPAFAPIMKEWLAYKRERSQAYKPRGLQACYTKLVNLSGNDPAKARAIVEQSMSNNYSGLFQLKIQDNGNNNNFRRTPADNIREAQEQHIRQLAESVSQAADRNGKVYESLPFD